jgi:hypothetical protein
MSIPAVKHLVCLKIALRSIYLFIQTKQQQYMDRMTGQNFSDGVYRKS